MAWVFLVLAGLLEIAFALSLKASHGFTRLGPSLGFLVAGAASFFFVTQALRTLPVGVAYAVWTGIGAAGTALFGIMMLGESRDVGRLLCILLIVAGVVGLKLTSSN